MNLGSQEHRDIIDAFERGVKSCHIPIQASRNFLKEDKAMWPKGHIYQDAVINALFVTYRMGYAEARCAYMHGTTPQ